MRLLSEEEDHQSCLCLCVLRPTILLSHVIVRSHRLYLCDGREKGELYLICSQTERIEYVDYLTNYWERCLSDEFKQKYSCERQKAYGAFLAERGFKHTVLDSRERSFFKSNSLRFISVWHRDREREPDV